MPELMRDLTVSLAAPLIPRHLYARFGKRALDVILATCLLPVLLPVIALLYVLVRRDGGSGFYGHTRIGLHGRRFRCWKLRTMVPDSDAILAQTLTQDPLAALEWARAFKLDKDPRVTRLGALLRQTGLDELPQIWNVLRGEMSFVGPRPITAGELAFYDGDHQTYLAQKPGVTGLWQVEGRGDGCHRKRVALDHRYRIEKSLPVDLVLIVRTAGLVFAAQGR